MKRFTIILLLLSATLTLSAQKTSMFSVSLGGGASTMTMADVKYSWGAMGDADLGYTQYYRVSKDVQIGFRTGLGLVFSSNYISRDYVDEYTFRCLDLNEYDYLISSPEVTYHQRQFCLEIPAMFAFENNGFFVNAGIKFQIPVGTGFEQTIKDPLIIAYSNTEGKTLINDPATGFVSESQRSMSGKAYTALCYFALSGEIGHQWKLQDGSLLGFTAFIDYAPLSIRPRNDGSKPLILVEHPNQYIGAEPAVVTVHQVTESDNFSFRQLNMGLKIIYSIDLKRYLR